MSLIYCLYSTEDGRPRYIGQTTRPLSRRLAQHLKKAEQLASGPLYAWIRTAFAAGYEVHAHAVQIGVVYSDLNQFERYWMEQFTGLLKATAVAPRALEDSSVGATLCQGLRQRLGIGRTHFSAST